MAQTSDDSISTLVKALAAIYLLVHWAYLRSRGRNWPIVTGRIENCERAEFDNRPFFTSAFAHRKTGVRLHYSFEVNGQKYWGHFAETGFSLENQKDDYMEKFKAATPVTVRYKPKDPNISELQYRDNPGLDVGLITGAPATRVDE